MTIEQLVRAVLARSLPERIAGEAADDLFEDHRRLRETRGSFSAAVFLIREATSLIGAFVAAAMSRFVRSLATVRRDLAHAVRAVMRRPGSSLGAILMLAAGLAAVAASSGLASTLLFRPISTRYPDDVRRLASSDLGGRTRLAFSEVELERVRDTVAGVANIAVANLQPVVLRVGDTDMQTLAEVVGGRYFEMIGLAIAVGRPLVDGDAAAGALPVAVISEGLWRDHFDRHASALGTSIRLNGRAFTIVGITASKSTSSFLGGSVDAWITLAHADAMLDRSWRTNPDNRWWTTLLHIRRDPGTGSREPEMPSCPRRSSAPPPLSRRGCRIPGASAS